MTTGFIGFRLRVGDIVIERSVAPRQLAPTAQVTSDSMTRARHGFRVIEEPGRDPAGAGSSQDHVAGAGNLMEHCAPQRSGHAFAFVGRDHAVVLSGARINVGIGRRSGWC